MDNSRNTAVRLTPPGVAAIAVIRFRGPDVAKLMLEHFSKPLIPGRCVHGEIKDGGRVIDDGLAVLCKPDTVDLNVHGGPWIVQSVLDLARRHGFEVSDSTAPLRAEAVDAVPEIQREILQYLPLARTELGVRIVLAQQKAWEELTIRFNRGAIDAAEIEAILADQTLTHLLYPPTVAIVGAANVGKSTLANQLFGQQRSITADVPGTTRDWVGEIANIEGLPVMLLDTPGQRQTHDEIEQAAIERAGEPISKSQLVVLVLDADRPLEGEQAQLLARYPAALKVMNKSDLPEAGDFPTLDVIRTVATTGQGVDLLRQRIVRFFCNQFPVSIDHPRCWTARQRELLESARKKRPHGGG